MRFCLIIYVKTTGKLIKIENNKHKDSDVLCLLIQHGFLLVWDRKEEFIRVDL
jgi:hypothetical protein